MNEIKWHKDCLLNQEKYLEKQTDRFKDLEQTIIKEIQDIEQYKLQIQKA